MKVIEWVPGKWWVVEVTGPDGSFTPLHEGKGLTSEARRKDCERWAELKLENIPALVTCPTCGHSFEKRPGDGAGVPGHSDMWQMCPGSYKEGETK